MSGNKKSRIDILVYFFISLLALLVTGIVFKVVFVVANNDQFTSLKAIEIIYALFWGLRFDLASAAFFSLISSIALWLSYRLTVRKNPAVLLLAFGLTLQLSLQISDAMYFAEAGRHVSYEMRDVFTDASGLLMTAVSKHLMFIALGYLLGTILVFTLLAIARKISVSSIKIIPPTRFKLQPEVGLLVVLILSLLFLRGGVTGIPQSVISAFKIGDAKQAIIAMNGSYSVVYGALNSSKEIDRVAVKLPDNINSDAVLRTLYPGASSRLFEQTVNPDAGIKKYNLIFILMEGWPADFMSAYGYEIDTTPFFAALKEKSFAPLGVIAGGVRTSEGIYATFCSQQNPLGETVAQSSLQNNPYECLPEILKQQGWQTAFFQGTHKETSGTGAFAQSLGFTESFAKEDMPTGRYEHNSWGAQDPDIYDFVLDKLDAMPQPFLIGINTNSTHDIVLPSSIEPAFGNANSEQKHQSVLHFSDQAMSAFFSRIKDKPYYKDTVFVLMSDHTHDKHKSIAAKYFIPGIIYSENNIPAKKLNRYVSQRDIAPTILDLLTLPAAPSFAGKSLFSADKDVYFADYFDAGTVGWIKDFSLVETSVTDPAKMRCYSIEKGLLHASPASCDEAAFKNSAESLVFTAYSQHLLFDGKTKNFYRFLER